MLPSSKLTPKSKHFLVKILPKGRRIRFPKFESEMSIKHIGPPEMSIKHIGPPELSIKHKGPLSSVGKTHRALFQSFKIFKFQKIRYTTVPTNSDFQIL